MESPPQFNEEMEVEELTKQAGEMKISYNWNNKNNQDRMVQNLKKETIYEGMQSNALFVHFFTILDDNGTYSSHTYKGITFYSGNMPPEKESNFLMVSQREMSKIFFFSNSF